MNEITYYFYLQGSQIQQWNRTDNEGYAYKRGIIEILEMASIHLNGICILAEKTWQQEKYVWICHLGKSEKT